MLDRDVIVCRCEEVTVGEIEDAIGAGATDIQGVKRRTRAGMGACQGRSCETTISRILAQRLGVPLAMIRPDSARPPTLTVALGTLSNPRENEEQS